MGLNSVHIIGNLGADPDFHTSKGGMGILKMRLAVGEKVKVGDKWEDKTEWITVVVFGKRAEGLQPHLKKGNQVSVVGKIRTSTYDDKEGNKRYKTEVVADDVLLLGRRGGPENGPTKNAQAEDDGEIPF